MAKLGNKRNKKRTGRDSVALIDGHQTILTPELHDNIARLYKLGLLTKAVAALVKVNPATIVRWLELGALPGADPIYRNFYYDCANAVSALEGELIGVIRNFALGTPEEYETEEVIVDGKIVWEPIKGPDGRPVIKKRATPPDPEWAAWLLEKRFAGHFGKQLGRENGINDELEKIKPTESASDGGVNSVLGSVVPQNTEEQLMMLELAKAALIKGVRK